MSAMLWVLGIYISGLVIRVVVEYLDWRISMVLR